MAPAEEMQTAMVNRSIRTIKAELEYLCDASIITPQTLSQLLSQIPPQTALHAPLSVGAVPSAIPTAAMGNLNLANQRANSNTTEHYNERANNAYNPTPSPQPPPPAYNNTPPPPQAAWSAPPLAHATALYAYTSADAGDLELQPNDRIAVTEYMNAEWWKGKSERTGREGIFPRSYVKVNEEKQAAGFQQPPPVGNPTANNYGNAPLEVSQMGNGTGEAPNKGAEMGKKFGKKLGNAAIFGAGATLGGNLVNSIF